MGITIREKKKKNNNELPQNEIKKMKRKKSYTLNNGNKNLRKAEKI